MKRISILGIFLLGSFIAIINELYYAYRVLSNINNYENYIEIFHHSSWTSPYEVDCNTITTFESNETFIKTSTDPSFYMKIHDPTVDLVLSKEVSESGCFECKYVKKIQRAMEYYKDAYLLDIGGNLGIYTLVTAAMGRESFTIEPLKENYERLCKSIVKNGFNAQTHVLNIAATDGRVADFFIVYFENNPGRAITKTISNTSKYHKNRVPYGKGIPVDHLNLPKHKPVILKLDVEAADLDVLKGARQFINESKLVYALMELRTWKVRKNPHTREIFDLLSSNGLKPFRQDVVGEKELDINNLTEWAHYDFPHIGWFDVIWKNPYSGL